jgi:hypothetical protein
MIEDLSLLEGKYEYFNPLFVCTYIPVKCNNSLGYVFFSNGAADTVGQGRIIEASRSHPDTPHSIGLLWTSDQPEARSKAEVCGSSLSAIAGLNPSGDMVVCLL